MTSAQDTGDARAPEPPEGTEQTPGEPAELAEAAPAGAGPDEVEATLDGIEATLDRVEAAIARVDEGTYGTCETCGQPIGRQRLEARPTTTTCADHDEAARPGSVDGA